MESDRIYAGVIGLFFITVIFFFGDPILNGELYTRTFALKPELAAAYLNGWERVTPVFIVACFYLIISGAKTRDDPSRFTSWRR